MTVAGRLRIITILTDWISTSIALVIFNSARYSLLSRDFHSLSAFLLSPAVMIGQIGFPVLMLLIYWLADYYGNPLHRSFTHDLISTALCALIGTIIVLLTALINDLTADRATDYILITLLWTLVTGIVGAARMALDFYTQRLSDSGQAADRCVLITHKDNHDSRAGMSGHIDVVETIYLGNRSDRKAAYDTCRHLLHAGTADNIVIDRDMPEPLQMEILSELLNEDRSIYIDRTPDALSRQKTGKRAVRLTSYSLTDLSRPKASGSIMNIKRLADISIATTSLIIMLPLIAIMAVIVRMDSKGPAFYCQERIGNKGRPFKMIKLRTMHENAETEGPTLTVPGDIRITRAGHLLRRYHLDELPQLWNVIKGEMSLVGPRPERKLFADKILACEPTYALTRVVRPGITSWGMVKYGYASSVEQMTDRLHYDLLYLDNINPGIDLKILFYTMGTVVSGKGL